MKLNEIEVDSTTVDELPFLNNPTSLTGLKAELSSYKAAVEDIDPEVDILQWWKSHEKELPNWSTALKNIILVQPSSAAAERVFSVIQNLFTEKCT